MERSGKLLLVLLVLLGGVLSMPAQAGSRPAGGSGIEQVQPPGTGGALQAACAVVHAPRAARPVGTQCPARPLDASRIAMPPASRKGDRALE